jgi:C4-dicarboxylate-specific signal transduction histidine kinase
MGEAGEQGKDIVWWSEPEEFGLVYSDASALEHIIANLVDNALRYGGDYIEITVVRDTDNFAVRVSDDGPGIPAHYRNHVSPVAGRRRWVAAKRRLRRVWVCTLAERWPDVTEAT